MLSSCHLLQSTAAEKSDNQSPWGKATLSMCRCKWASEYTYYWWWFCCADEILRNSVPRGKQLIGNDTGWHNKGWDKAASLCVLPPLAEQTGRGLIWRQWICCVAMNRFSPPAKFFKLFHCTTQSEGCSRCRTQRKLQHIMEAACGKSQCGKKAWDPQLLCGHTLTDLWAHPHWLVGTPHWLKHLHLVSPLSGP